MFKKLKTSMGGGKTPVKSSTYRFIAISLCLIFFISCTLFVSSVSVNAKPKKQKTRSAVSKRAMATGTAKRAGGSGRVNKARVLGRTKSNANNPSTEVATTETTSSEKEKISKTTLKKCPVEKTLGKKFDEDGNELYYTSKNKSKGEEFCDESSLSEFADEIRWSESDKDKYPKVASLNNGDDIVYFKCREGYIAKNGSDGIRTCMSICPLNVVLEKSSEQGQYISLDTGNSCSVPANATARLVKDGENTRGDLDDKEAYIIECNANKYSSVLEGASSSVHYQCLTCPSGYVSVAGAKSKDECREECKNGQVRLESGSCTTCDSNASVVDNACVCKDGYFGIGYGENGCEVCPEGYICSGGEKKTKYIQEEATISNEQQSCPEGSRASADGLTCECNDVNYQFDSKSNSCVLATCEAGKILKNGECVECPSGHICPTSSTWVLSSECDKVEVKNFTSVGTGTGTLSSGVYLVEVAGAGAGSGGGIKACGACSTKKYDSGKGGNGDLKTSEYIYVSDTLNYTYIIGKGGAGSSRASCRSDGKYGADGEKSSFTFLSQTLTAEGGKGGRSVYGKATSCHDGNNGADAGNGKGGAGGGKRNGGNDSGNSGSNGWVKIYQLNCNK